MATESVDVNRAAVLTLWAAVVAERLGFDEAEALTLGRAVAGLNAYAKGKALGLFAPTPAAVKAERKRERRGTIEVDLLGRAVPSRRTEGGVRALSKEKPIDPDSVRRYLASKLGEALQDVTAAMKALARSRTPARLADEAYGLYESFRPEVPRGRAGWGAKGRLDLGTIRRLAGR